MMKHEFESLIGFGVSQDCYEKIEVVYMESDKDFNKQSLASFYKKKDMNGIEEEYKKILSRKEVKTLESELMRMQKQKDKWEAEALQAQNDTHMLRKENDQLRKELNAIHEILHSSSYIKEAGKSYEQED